MVHRLTNTAVNFRNKRKTFSFESFLTSYSIFIIPTILYSINWSSIGPTLSFSIKTIPTQAHTFFRSTFFRERCCTMSESAYYEKKQCRYAGELWKKTTEEVELMFQTLVGKCWYFVLAGNVLSMVPLAMVSRVSFTATSTNRFNLPNHSIIQVLSLCNKRVVIALAGYSDAKSFLLFVIQC